MAASHSETGFLSTDVFLNVGSVCVHVGIFNKGLGAMRLSYGAVLLITMKHDDINTGHLEYQLYLIPSCDIHK